MTLFGKKSTYITIIVLLLALTAVGLYFYLNPKRALEFVVPNLSGVSEIS